MSAVKRYQWSVQRLVEKRIVEIDYLMHMHDIERDLLSRSEIKKLVTESSDLKIWLAQNGVVECPAM